MRSKVVSFFAWTLAAILFVAGTCHAQSVKTSRVGVMINGSSRPFLDRFQEDFAKLGYVGDKRVVIEGKFADGKIDHHPLLAQELVASGVDVILACQSAPNIDPLSASNFDPLERRVLAVALAPSELVGVAKTARARVV